MRVIIKDDDDSTLIEFDLIAKDFKSGKAGYFGQAKLNNDSIGKLSIQTLIINKSAGCKPIEKSKCPTCGIVSKKLI